MHRQPALVDAHQLHQYIAVAVGTQLAQVDGAQLAPCGDRAGLVAEGGEALGPIVDQLRVVKLPFAVALVHDLVGHAHGARGDELNADLLFVTA